MTALFDPEPVQWGLRGDPHVWRRMRDLMAEGTEPATVEEGVRLLHEAFRQVVGVGLRDGTPEDRMYRADLDFGGMSGGWVDLEAWRQRLMPLLEMRLAAPGTGAPSDR